RCQRADGAMDAATRQAAAAAIERRHKAVAEAPAAGLHSSESLRTPLGLVDRAPPWEVPVDDRVHRHMWQLRNLQLKRLLRARAHHVEALSVLRNTEVGRVDDVDGDGVAKQLHSLLPGGKEVPR